MTNRKDHRYLGIAALSVLLTLTAITGGRSDDTATLLPNAIQYFMDANGKPLANGKVFMYTPSTTTPKATWTTASKSVLQPQPFIPLGISGKPANPIYGDGSYRQLVKDQFNNTIWDFNTASTGGGGSTPVTPTVGDGLIVGSVLPWTGLTPPANYLFAYGQQINRTTYSLFFSTVTIATDVICTSGLNVLSGISDTKSIRLGAPVEASCIPPGTTVTAVAANSVTISANASVSTAITARFFPFGNGNGSTTFNMPNFEGQVLAGRNNMSGTPGASLDILYYGTSPNALGALGGSQFHDLTLAQLPLGIISSTRSPISLSVTTTDATIPNAPGGLTSSNAAGGVNNQFSGVTSTVASRASTGTITTGGVVVQSDNTGGENHSIVQPTITVNYIVKVLPDVSTVVASGVASISGMTGVLLCGSGLTCGSNTISATAASSNLLIGLTPITGAVNHGMLYNNGSVLGDLAASGLGLIGSGTPDTGISITSTGNVLNIFDGKFGGPYTSSLSPSVFIYRNESISGILNGYSAALNVGITGVGIVGGYQTQAITATAVKDAASTGGDVVGIYGSSVHYGSNGAAFGGFFVCTNVNAAWCFAIETQTTNGSGIDYPYSPTPGFSPIAVALDLSYGGSFNGSPSALGSAAILIRASPNQWDVGIGFMNGNSIKTASIQDDTNAIRIIYAHTGTHTDGIDLTGAGATTYSNCAYKSPLFCISGTGGVKLSGSSSGTATIVAQAVAGTPTLTLPNASGTFAVSASSPIVLSATTGNISCPTCSTTVGAALTKADDTNVTLTLGGSPTTALLAATSITAGWTGILSGTRGGTGVNNGASTITIGGNVVHSGAFTTTLTVTATTNSTLPAGTHTLAGLDVAQTWSAVQQLNSGNFKLAGATSGLLTINCAVACGTNTLTLPGGTTDFSATGGTSQVVKQTSSGGAFTVGQLAFTDISGTIATGQVSGSYTGITGVGTLTAGATGAGFTVALTTSTVTGTLPCANHPALSGDITTPANSCVTTLASTITAGGPTGGATSIPVITYDAKGRLTAVTTATPTVTAVNGVSYPASFTSGGIPYASSTSAISSSAVLTAGSLIQGGGAGVAPSSVSSGQLPATATNDDAAAGKVGEYLTATGSAVAITSATPTNITSKALTAGDWDVSCTIKMNAAASTTISTYAISVNSSSAALDTTVGLANELIFPSAAVPGAGFTPTIVSPIVRASLSGTTTYYCVGYVVYGVSTLTMDGFIRARRVR